MTGNEGGWEGLAPWQQAQEWQANAPDMAAQVLAEGRIATAHRRAMEIRYFKLQVASLIASFFTVVILGAVAWHAADARLAVPTIAAAGGGGLVAGSVAVLGKGAAARKRRGGKSKR